MFKWKYEAQPSSACGFCGINGFRNSPADSLLPIRDAKRCGFSEASRGEALAIVWLKVVSADTSQGQVGFADDCVLAAQSKAKNLSAGRAPKKIKSMKIVENSCSCFLTQLLPLNQKRKTSKTPTSLKPTSGQRC